MIGVQQVEAYRVRRRSSYCPSVLGDVFHTCVEICVIFPYACICKPRIGIGRSGNRYLNEFATIEPSCGLVAQPLLRSGDGVGHRHGFAQPCRPQSKINIGVVVVEEVVGAQSFVLVKDVAVAGSVKALVATSRSYLDVTAARSAVFSLVV